MAAITVRADGVYVTVNGVDIPLDGIARVTAGGAVVVRFPARDVTVVENMDMGRWLDCSDIQKCILAVVYGGITLQQIAAVRPGVASAVQTYMTNHGLTAGSVD